MADDPLAWLSTELQQLEDAQLRRLLRVRAGRQSATITLDGRSVVNLGANDYLGLASDPRVIRAACEAAEREGWGSGASPLIVGRSQSHAQLETELARFEETEAALVFNTGFAANAGTIDALVGPDDAIFSDALNHASIVDGCRLAKATTHVYRHADVGHLENLLQRAPSARRKLIVTDTLFSMDGDLAPLPDLVEVAQRHCAMLMVDEAHATGLFGPHGRGVVEHFGPRVEAGVSIRIGTLSKALGSSGGFVVGQQSLIDWLANRARSYIFSTAPPPAVCAAALAALAIVKQEPARRSELLAQAAWLRTQLQRDGWNIGRSASHIIPLVIGSPEKTMLLSAALLARGYCVPGIRPPSVPAGQSRLRLSLSCTHHEAMLTPLLEILRDLRRQGIAE